MCSNSDPLQTGPILAVLKSVNSESAHTHTKLALVQTAFHVLVIFELLFLCYLLLFLSCFLSLRFFKN